MYIFDQIKNSRHEIGLDCSFLNMEFVSEKQEGFRSVFKFSCKMCKIITCISSEKSNPLNYIPINDAVVSGTIGIGIGFSQLVEFSAPLEIPYMSNTTYSSILTNMGDHIHQAALKEIIIAGQEEKEFALQTGNVDEDGVPMCTVVADGQWSKRSYKTKYDALSGVVSIYIISKII